MDVVALPNFDVKILLACTLPLCDAAQQLRSHCPDAGIKENVSCFFYRDINFVEQQGFRMVNFTSASMRKVATLTHQVDWPWVAAALCTFVLLGSLARWLCTVLPDPRHATYEALRQVERDLEITEQMKTRMRILAETVMLAIDLALDLKVGVYYCSQKLWLFGPVALAIPGLAGLACFGYKRWNWRQATPDANQRMAQRTQYYFQKLDAKGHAKPNLLVMLRHVFQLEAFATAYQAYQKPELYERDWLVERTFNGALEAFPQCLLQTYTLLCLEQEDMLKDPMDTATQLVSIAFSCYGITTALQHMSFSLLPEESISPLPLGFAGWQLQLLQFMDVASRLLTWATLGAAWRTPSAAIDENCEFGLPILMALELIGVVGLLHASLRWTSSFSSEAILSAAIAYLTMPMLVFNASYANMSKLQGSLCFWRAVETFTCLCFVWYRGHAVSEPDGLLLAFMACSVFTHIVVHATVMYDRAMRFQHGRPVLPAIHAAQFTEAHWACALNNLQLLQDSGPEALCARARHGWVPAHVAAWSGNEALLRLLHNMVPESLSARTDHDWVPAEVAALNSHEAALRLRYDLVADHQDWTPAHLAAHCGHEATLKLLHDLVPVSLSTRTRRGWVPAHLAALHGHGDVLRLLHDLVPETFSSKDNDDWVPAHLAAQNGHTASLGFMYLLVPESLSARTNRDWVPAHVAALNGHGAALRLLYDLVPATLSAKTHHDSVAAHLAALNGHKDWVTPNKIQNKNTSGPKAAATPTESRNALVCGLGLRAYRV